MGKDIFTFRANYSRYVTKEVIVGNVLLGGQNPVRIQSMTNTETRDVDATVAQIIRIIEKGADLVRVTVPSVKDNDYLREIHHKLRENGYHTPVVADVHFNPVVAEQAAAIVEKVRINPGNYSGISRTDYNEKEFDDEYKRIKEKFTRLIEICKKNHTALRIGVNHGSLSARIVSRFGDTPPGMAESAMEFIRICHENSFYQVAVSMKASNTLVMVQATRLLTEKMTRENIVFPLHLGVTEAGEGEDGRIKSAAGIGALLIDGIGDTIRVSLTEDPEAEIPVASKITRYILDKKQHSLLPELPESNLNPFEYNRRDTYVTGITGGKKTPVVLADFSEVHPGNTPDKIGWIYDQQRKSWSFTDQAADGLYLETYPEEGVYPPDKMILLPYKVWKNRKGENFFPVLTGSEYSGSKENGLKFVRVTYEDTNAGFYEKLKTDETVVIILESEKKYGIYGQRNVLFHLPGKNIKTPVILKNSYEEDDYENFQLFSSVDLGVFLIDGLVDGIWLSGSGKIAPEKVNSTVFGILQATRARISKTEYISCPSCGRTNFNLMETAASIRRVTGHLKGLKIGIMGCIVNGIGEMADADYGYVGSGKGKITLYKAKQVVKRNVPEEHAVEELIMLIKENGDWKEKHEDI